MNTQAIAPLIMHNLVAVVESGALMTTLAQSRRCLRQAPRQLCYARSKLSDARQNSNALNFEAVEYLDLKGGETRKAWNMTKTGFMFLVVGLPA